jgi:hypothetical protein
VQYFADFLASLNRSIDFRYLSYAAPNFFFLSYMNTNIIAHDSLTLKNPQKIGASIKKQDVSPVKLIGESTGLYAN